MKRDFHPSPTIWILHFVLATKMYFIYRLKSYISTPLIRKGSHAENKASHSVSFQMFLILLSFITLGSESQISVFKLYQSNT